MEAHCNVPNLHIPKATEYIKKKSEHWVILGWETQIPTNKVKRPLFPNFSTFRKEKETTKLILQHVHTLHLFHFEILKTWFGSRNGL